MRKIRIFFLLICFINYVFISSTHGQDLLLSKDNAHFNGVSSFCLSYDGSLILTGGIDKKTFLWNSHTLEKQKGALLHNDAVTSVAISANNKFYVSGSADFKIRVYDIEQNIPIRILSEHTSSISSVTINPVTNFIASGSKDNSIKVWDNSKSKNSAFTLTNHLKEITSLAYSPDGKMLCSSSLDNTIKYWDATKYTLIKSTDLDMKGVTCLAFSSEGKYLVAGGVNGNVVLINVNSGEKIKLFDGGKSQINAVAISGDNQYVVAGCKDSKIIVWRIDNGKIEKNDFNNLSEVTGVSFNETGNALVSTSLDGNINVWNVSDLRIGKKLYLKSDNPFVISIVNLLIEDTNSNGLIEVGEKSALVFDVVNDGNENAYNMSVKVLLKASDASIKFEQQLFIGNVEAKNKQTIKIPFVVNSTSTVDKNSFVVSILDPSGNLVKTGTIQFHIGNTSNYGFISVANKGFYSATGKSEIGAPMTVAISVKNITNIEAKNIKVGFILPQHVHPVNAISETIPTLSPNEEKIVKMDFFVNKEYALSEITVGLDLGGVPFSNAKDIVLTVKMNDKLPLKFSEQPITIHNDALQSSQITIVQPRVTRGEKLVWVENEITIKGVVQTANNVQQFFINGIPVPCLNKSFSHVVKLAYRDNYINVKAIDDKGTVIETNLVVERQMKIANLNDTLKRHGIDYALIIVTDDYDNFPKLTNPVNDGLTIAKELEARYGFKTEVIKNPTRAEVYVALRNYSKKVFHDEDQLLIFIAGHGEFDDVFAEGYIVTKDSKMNDEVKESFISHSNLRTIINNIPCKHILLTMDVCFGGTFDQFVAAARGADLYTDVEKDKFIQKKLQYTTRKYLTSGGKEYVPDGRPGEHSPFARKYLEALRSDGGQDQILTFHELYSYIEKAVPGPKTGEFGSNQPGSDFLFIYKK